MFVIIFTYLVLDVSFYTKRSAKIEFHINFNSISLLLSWIGTDHKQWKRKRTEFNLGICISQEESTSSTDRMYVRASAAYYQSDKATSSTCSSSIELVEAKAS